jgi:hypothetical protein
MCASQFARQTAKTSWKRGSGTAERPFNQAAPGMGLAYFFAVKQDSATTYVDVAGLPRSREASDRSEVAI